MFRRDHHIRIASVLQLLDADFLKAHACYFGGGTAITLLKNEYRESIDIDFLCSDLEKYRSLRQEITEKDLQAITHSDAQLNLLRETRVDQYGIRNMLKVGSSEIKFEIIFEARITLETPSDKDNICGIATLTEVDMASSKLLANSDRWADRSVYSRDLIDLAMLDLPKTSFRKAFTKATTAYSSSVERDLRKAVARMKEEPDWLEECMDALKIDSTPKAKLWDKIRSLPLDAS